MDIVIKKMETEAETRGKAFVHWKSWHEAYPGLVCADFLNSLTFEKCETIAFRWPDNVWIAKDGDRVIGFVAYGNRNADMPDAGEIIALYVLSAYYGTGVGKRLMEKGLEQFGAYKTVFLWVLKGNARAIRFYEKCGFRADGEETYSAAVSASEIRMVLTR